MPSFSSKNTDSDEVFVTLTDDVGRTLTCSVEYSLEIEGQEYALLFPVDSPIEILTWHDEEHDDEAAVPVESDTEIDRIFETAKAVLAEQCLTLQRTAVTLTVEGELPDFNPEQLSNLVTDHPEETEYEELLWLASFYYEEQEYGIYTPLDPFFILARITPAGTPELLSVEEFQRLEPMLSLLEEQFFDDLE